jgi:hypothetical protein
MKRHNFFLDEDLVSLLKDTAKARKISMAYLIREILITHFLERSCKKI